MAVLQGPGTSDVESWPCPSPAASQDPAELCLHLLCSEQSPASPFMALAMTAFKVQMLCHTSVCPGHPAQWP